MSRIVLVCLLSILLASCQSAPPRTWELPPGVKATSVNGYDLAYVEYGRGVPVVMVHGSLVDYRAFRAQLEPFGDKYRAIAVSLRHYYPEHWNGTGEGFSERQHSADVAAFIRSLDAGPVVVIGHSRGGIIALHVARSYPDVVRTLVLAEPGLNAILGPSDPGAAIRQPRINKTLQLFDKGDIEGGLEFFIDDVAGAGSWKKRPEPERQLARDNAWTLKGDQPHAQAPFTCQDAGQIIVPVLLIGAEQSPPVFGKILDVLASCLKRSERVMIPNASHTMNRMNPSAFNKAVLDFLARQ